MGAVQAEYTFHIVETASCVGLFLHENRVVAFLYGGCGGGQTGSTGSGDDNLCLNGGLFGGGFACFFADQGRGIGSRLFYCIRYGVDDGLADIGGSRYCVDREALAFHNPFGNDLQGLVRNTGCFIVVCLL